jgi:hypothetical protein
MGNELHEDARAGRGLKRTLHRGDRARAEIIGQAVELKAGFGAGIFAAWRRPHFDLIACGEQAARDLLRVVGDATALWRIFTGDDVPFQTATAILTPRPL